jgi:hypothetical protein
MESATGTIYFGDSVVDRHPLITQNTHSIYPSSWSHALLLSFIDPNNVCRSSRTITHRLLIHSLWVVHHGRVSLHILSPSSYTPRTALDHELPSYIMQGAANCRCWVACLVTSLFHDTVIKWSWRCTQRRWSSSFGHTLGGCNRVRSEMHLEAVITVRM